MRNADQLLMTRAIRSFTQLARARRLVAGLVALVAAIAAVGAYAYFTASASGTGSASAGTLQPVTVTAFTGSDSPSSPLLPGGTGDVILRISNPNPYAVTLVAVTGGPGSISADAGHPSCTTTGVTFTGQTSLSNTIAGSGTTLVDLPGAAAMSSASSNGCQGASFSIPVTITVHKG
jgi:hypothetical protein